MTRDTSRKYASAKFGRADSTYVESQKLSKILEFHNFKKFDEYMCRV